MNHYRPLTIIGLLAAAVVVFAVEQRSEVRFADEYGAIPSVIVPAVRSLMHGDFSLPVFRQLSRLVTALFLHGSGEHLLGNLIFCGYLVT